MKSKGVQYWSGRNVLVTGHEGFLGSNLTKKLVSYGARVVGLDIRTERQLTIFTAEDYRGFKSVRGNVANRSLVERLIKENGIQDVFHLAAEALVGDCLRNPLRAFRSNIQGTWEIFEACRHADTIESIVAASSDKAYGSHDDLPYTEGTALVGDHPYDVSKSCADLIAYMYFNTFALPVTVTRCGNIYGPGDFNFSRIIPDTIRKALRGKPIIIRSDGSFTRDYVFVNDIANGYILLAENMKEGLQGESFNLSAEKPYSVLEVVQKIYEMTGQEPMYEIQDRVEFEINHQYLDSEKIRRRIGWSPDFDLEHGLATTIDWYRKYLCLL